MRAGEGRIKDALLRTENGNTVVARFS